MSAHSDILNLARQLPEKDRAALAHDLIMTLEPNNVDDDEIASAWQNEIDLRLKKIASGTHKTHDWRAAIQEIRQDLKKEKP